MTFASSFGPSADVTEVNVQMFTLARIKTVAVSRSVALAAEAKPRQPRNDKRASGAQKLRGSWGSCR